MGGLARRLIFGIFAVVLTASEIASNGPAIHGNTATIWWIILGYGLLALTGWFPATAGFLYCVATLVAVLTPGDVVVVVLPLLGVFAVAADWTSRGWYVAAGLAIITTSSAEIALSETPTATSLGVLLGTAMAAALGLGVRWNGERFARLNEENEAARRSAVRARDEVRREIATTLHGSVNDDLVRLVVGLQGINRTTSDAQSAEDARSLTDVARDAMIHLKALVASALPDPGSDELETTAHVVLTCRAMLRGRDISLDATVPEGIDDVLSRRQRVVLALVVREGATNVFKYARAGTRAFLTVSLPDQDGVLVRLINDIDPASDQARATVRGGFGLESLTTEVAREGGAVNYGSRGATWLLEAEIPGAASDQ